MPLFALTALVMVAFAANSILNRLALVGGGIGAMEFALWRIGSGAVALAVLVWLRDRRLALHGPNRLWSILSLAAYFLGFSAAYLDLDAGAGALILFGGVQITMFIGALVGGEQVPPQRFAGAALAFGGLVWLFWPGGTATISLFHGGLMAVAALGWGIYSLLGRRSGEPLRATAANFILATPVIVLALLLWPSQSNATGAGIALALVSGVVTSAMGYALWFHVLPSLRATVASVAQLTVPVIALAGGALFLSESITGDILIASTLVMGGVTLSLMGSSRTP